MPLKPGSTIGILGGGQLGGMTAQAAQNLGYKTHVFTPEQNSPASQVATQTTVAAFDDETALLKFAQSVDVVTLEFENVPVAACDLIKENRNIFPDPALLTITQDRISEKTFINDCGIGTAPWHPVTTIEDARVAGEKLGFPFILKTARMGYDGKGQIKLETPDDLQSAWSHLNSNNLIAEGFIEFVCEVSVIIARDQHGALAHYPVVENTHKDHILYQTMAPADIPSEMRDKAHTIAHTLATRANLVGLLAVEMFITHNGILVNELAPRPHNSGHWTIEACPCSQFEQLVRVVTGQPLGKTQPHFAAIMTNILGDDIHNLSAMLENSRQAYGHTYGKTESRPGRKMGHVTVLHPLEDKEATDEQNRRMGTQRD